jgi:ESCRT-II complex subunit VPS36
LDENLDGHGGLESEIARVARPLLELQGGMVLLEEVYCAVNRARGTSLVSPDEVYSAAKHIAEKCPQAGLKYKKYKSGITVLQDNSISDNAIIDEVNTTFLAGKINNQMRFFGILGKL